MPFSNEKREGFENRIAELLASDLKLPLEYTWWTQRRSFVKNTLDAGRCDVILGIPAEYPGIATTLPYYKSSYALIYRTDGGPAVRSINDPRLKKLRIGMHVVGRDFAPPAAVLAMRGVVGNIFGYSLFGPYGDLNPPSHIIDALANREIDVAIAWGPLAGYFAKPESGFEVVPLRPDSGSSNIPLSYAISMGVRKNDAALKVELDQVLERKRLDVRKILDEYGVPRVL